MSAQLCGFGPGPERATSTCCCTSANFVLKLRSKGATVLVNLRARVLAKLKNIVAKAENYLGFQ
jgi:hypothetical protein